MSELLDYIRIRRADFPPQTQAQGMAAQASAWLLAQIERNNMTEYEALQIAMHMLSTVVALVGREEARRRAADADDPPF